MTRDLMEFKTPYSRGNKLRRMVWSLTWACFARPFPKSMAMGWKRCLLRLFGAKIADTAAVYYLSKPIEDKRLIPTLHAAFALAERRRYAA